MARKARKVAAKRTTKKVAKKAAPQKRSVKQPQRRMLTELKRTALFDPQPVALESYHFWRSVGYDHEGACAWLGNEEGEDSFDNTRLGDNQQAHGPAQMHDNRIDIIKQPPPKGCGIDMKTAGHLDQLKAIDWSTQHEPGYTKVKDRIMRAKGLRNKVKVIVTEYERSRLQDRDISRRTAYASYWAEKIPPHINEDPT